MIRIITLLVSSIIIYISFVDYTSSRKEIFEYRKQIQEYKIQINECNSTVDKLNKFISENYD